MKTLHKIIRVMRLIYHQSSKPGSQMEFSFAHHRKQSSNQATRQIEH